MAGERVWISYIEFPAGMAAKLASKHHLTVDDIRDTFELPGVPQRGAWDDNPTHGLRLVVEGVSPRGHWLVAILKPSATELDSWKIRTAWRVVR